ncbi:MAG: alpha/beta hydrolase [Lysobacterales bacterium]|jgi:pimeloyl-ACP methyl ester carboxylesterase
MRIAEAGDAGAPLVILAHGWPESWYSWRHQIPALARAGYHVVAPDMRGYGGTEVPQDVDAYDILHLVEDMAGLVAACGRERAAIVGHDWGAVVAWHAALLRPEVFHAVAALSVPHLGRPPAPPTVIWRRRYGDEFFYILYHQEPGVAEREYEADPEGLLRMLYASPDAPRAPPTITDPARGAGGFIGRWGRPLELPAWLTEEDFAFYVGEFRHSGFRGGLNYYRNFDRNWTLMEGREEIVGVPALFIAGGRDLVVAHLGADEVERRLRSLVPRLEQFVWIDDAGHWIQQERPDECNRALIEFLGGLGTSPDAGAQGIP